MVRTIYCCDSKAIVDMNGKRCFLSRYLYWVFRDMESMGNTGINERINRNVEQVTRPLRKFITACNFQLLKLHMAEIWRSYQQYLHVPRKCFTGLAKKKKHCTWSPHTFFSTKVRGCKIQEIGKKWILASLSAIIYFVLFAINITFTTAWFISLCLLSTFHSLLYNTLVFKKIQKIFPKMLSKWTQSCFLMA